MQSDPLSPGDCVVPLAGLSTQCSTIAGALSLGCVLFQASAPGIWIVGGILIGAAVGFATGGLFARVFYPATQDQVVVVRAGRSALASTLPAAFVPSAVCSFALTIATSAILDAPTFSIAVIIAAIASFKRSLHFWFWISAGIGVRANTVELKIAADHAAFGGIALSLVFGPHVG